ncbi:hypothetical protein [Motilimonas pumila]|uniref:Uncharacterized protein n=1 Tax=Motilimonas pumila TaxID=2303987 RepID=A0A418Y9Y6_9GAMM|nr:hypothetical protein [Motilimonas pumila]RJG38607.1 hypothetical protein D1Z90_18810 [Motilimonas pumila]
MKHPTRSVIDANTPKNADNPHVKSKLKLARKLHRAAKNGAISEALPAIRRLHAAGASPLEKVSDIYHSRHQLQRKHFLRMLALEAGFSSWQTYLPTLKRLPDDSPSQNIMAHNGEHIAKLNLWFATQQQAQDYAQTHGGQAFSYGHQGVVVTAQEASPQGQQTQVEETLQNATDTQSKGDLS